MDDSNLLPPPTLKDKDQGSRSGSPLAYEHDASVVGSGRMRRRSSVPDSRPGMDLLPASDWLGSLDTLLPERPASSIPFSCHPGFDDLFPAVVPPRRPLTASPERPHQPTARRTSEAVAIERIFSNFSLPPTPEPVIPEEQQQPPTSRPFGTGAVASTIVDTDASFRADLANVLVWFEQDLTNSQRITTAFTLLNHLTTWQLRFLLSLLSKPSQDFQAEAQMLHHPEPLTAMAPPSAQEELGAPPGFDSARRPGSPSRPQSPLMAQGKRSPLPAAFRSYRNTAVSPGPSNTSTGSYSATSPALSGTASVSSTAELTLEQCSPELFDRDLGVWLRSLRLHKYSGCFAGRSQAELLALSAMEDQTAAEARLEQLGVAALGARRKILRVLSTIRASR